MTIECLGGCTGLSGAAPYAGKAYGNPNPNPITLQEWWYNPNKNSGQPHAGLSFDVHGYGGTWQFVDTGPGPSGSVPAIAWRIDWSNASAETLTVRHQVVGTVTAVTFDNTITVYADADGTVMNTAQTCVAGGGTAAVNLTAIATKAMVNPARYAIVYCTLSTYGTSNLTGTFEISCV